MVYLNTYIYTAMEAVYGKSQMSGGDSIYQNWDYIIAWAD